MKPFGTNIYPSPLKRPGINRVFFRLAASLIVAWEPPRRQAKKDAISPPESSVAKGIGATTDTPPLICTIGHSNRTLVSFLDLLQRNEIVRVLDVRTVPGSRHNPQFNKETLQASLAAVQLSYSHLPGLGGLRRAQANSLNTGWHNLSFRGYADYMQTSEFADNVQRVADLARTERCVLMCSEAVPWRCHRSLIADALLVRGICVEDIIGPKERKPHVLTAFAHVDGLQITYPPPNGD